ncbi:hypothetical protein PCANC_24921 [Puccinia coronata f. sp. avenae]|uniref:SANT domain-containing protein n=1 Tax=Puccinia coronata f. sp. avenae TaxID=200324 RepID=A0A2N5TU84_9BASI|nr:hypothetical protein PCANC_24921 [Puccinia coronata f. sp. avenae]PLW40503.1 hypothetical protein PCASD_08831 [Puccinia coronata f. sp. avenae]
MSKTLPQERSQPDRMDEDDGTNTDTYRLVQNLREAYRAYHLEWTEHCEAMDRLRLRLTRKKRPTLTTPVTATLDLSAGLATADSAGAIPPSSAGITSSLTATGRTTRRTANFSTFGIGDAVTDAQFDLVLAQLGTADQKDPNIRAMKTTATVPDMALLPKHRLVSISDDENDTLVTDPIAFYQLTPPETESPSSLPEISNWTAQEQEAFEKSYAAQPKQFGWIASQVKTRTRAECVIHYYRTKRENKYRNLHLPPQAVIEGKPRELRGKRSRKVPCKTLTTDAATNTLKPKLKTNPELPQTLGEDQPDDESTEFSNYQSEPTPRTATAPDPSLNNCSNSTDELAQTRLNADLGQLSFDSRSMQTSQANETDSSTTTTTTTTHRFSSSTHRDLLTPSLPAPSPQQSIMDPLEKHSAASRAELNELSTRSAESNPPTIMLTNQVPTAQFEPPMKPLDPRPAPSTAMPPKLHEQQPPDPPSHPPSKPPPRAYKKRKVHPTIDTSSTATLSSHPAPPTQPASAMDHSKVAPPSTSRPDANSYDPSKSSGLSSHPPNPRDPTSAQANVQAGLRQARGLEHICSSENRSTLPMTDPYPVEVDEPAARTSVAPQIVAEAPVMRSSMQIKNLLNDDPVEPSESMSNMDASAWFGNDSQEPTPTEEPPPDPEPRTQEKPLLKLPSVERALLPPPGDYYHHPANLPRPLSQPLSQPSFQSLPRPLSRPPSRPSNHSQPMSSSLPPLPFHHRHHQNPSESGAEYAARHSDGMVVDERFADPPSAPGSPSGGGYKFLKDTSSSRGHPEPVSTPGRSSMSFQTRYERGLPTGHDRVQEQYPPSGATSQPSAHTHMSSSSHLQPHAAPSQSPRAHSHYSSQPHPPPTQGSHTHSSTSPHGGAPHLPSPFHYAHPSGAPGPSSSGPPRHMRASPTATRAPPSSGQFPPGPPPPHFGRLPPMPAPTRPANVATTDHLHPVADPAWPPPPHHSSHPGPFPADRPSSSSWTHHQHQHQHPLHHHHPPPPSSFHHHVVHPGNSSFPSASSNKAPDHQQQQPLVYSSSTNPHHPHHHHHHVLPSHHHHPSHPGHPGHHASRPNDQQDLAPLATPRSASDSHHQHWDH